MKCPACGYEPSKQHNTTAGISKMLKERNKNTKKALTKIATIINSTIPSQDRDAYWRFLWAIRYEKDGLVEHAIENYYQKRYYLQGKGFPYLRKIVQTLGKDSESLKQLERKRIGGVPPVIEITETVEKEIA